MFPWEFHKVFQRTLRKLHSITLFFTGVVSGKYSEDFEVYQSYLEAQLENEEEESDGQEYADDRDYLKVGINIFGFCYLHQFKSLTLASPRLTNTLWIAVGARETPSYSMWNNATIVY